MTNRLFKITSAATTGKPGTPGHPAYCETKPVATTTGRVEIFEILSMVVIDGPTLEDPTRPVTGIVRRRSLGFTAGVTTITYVKTCYLAVAAIPGIPGTSATQNPGWNGGARTIQFITGSGAFRFHIAPQTVGAVVGIGTTPDPDFSFNAVTHGFYASRGDYTIMESGTPVYGPISYVAGQEFAVNVVGMTVQYLVDGAVVHTSGVPRNGVAFPTAVLYLAGDSVYNASITEGISSPASAFGEFLPLVATGVMPSEFNPFSASGKFKPMTSEADGASPVIAQGSFESMASSGSMDPSVSFTAAGAFRAMTSDAGGSSPVTAMGSFEPMAAYGAMRGSALSFTAAGHFEPMISEGEGLTPVYAAGALKPMTSIAADRPVAVGIGAMESMTSDGEMSVPTPVFAAAAGTFAPMQGFALLAEPSSFFYDPLISLGDGNAAWDSGSWDGTTVFIVGGTGAGQSAAVVGNNGQVLWLDINDAWVTIPDGGSIYEIRDAEGNVLYTGTASAPTGPQTMRPMIGLASEGAYAESRVVLGPLTGSAYEFFDVDGVARLTLSNPFSLWAWAYQTEPDSFSGVMPPGSMVGYSGAVAEVKVLAPTLLAEGTVDVIGRARVKAPMPTLVATGTLLDRGQAAFQAPSPTVQAFSGAVAALSGLTPQLMATGMTVTIGRAVTQAPRVQITAFGGAVARMTAPAPSVLASGTIMDTGRAAMKAPRATVSGFSGAVAALTTPRASLDAAGAMVVIGSARLSMRYAHTMRAFSGAVLTQRLPSPTLLSSSKLGAVGRSNTVMPAPQLVAAGQRWVFGRAELVMPAPMLRTGLNAAEMVAPMFRLSALAAAVDTALREAWAVNLDATGDGSVFAVTHYTDYPIQQIVEFDGSAYGITATGLFRLEGDTDNEEAISWSVQTTPTDYGSIQSKRAIAAYLGGNLGPTAQVSVFVGEKSTESYTYPNVRGANLQNHRVQFGRGMKARHYAYGVSDAAGGELDLQSLDVEIVPIGRAV